MSRTLRILATLLTIGSFALLLQGPLCAEGRCPMDMAAATGICEELGADCCQSHGSAPPTLPQSTAPAPAAYGGLDAVTADVAGPVLHALAEPAAPAIIQGVGLFTLFAVFLI